MSNGIKVLVVDDDSLIRDGLKMILSADPEITVAGAAANGQEAVKLCADLLPDVVLMDIRMPVMDGVQASKLIKEQFRDIKVLMLTTFRDDEYIRSAVRNGAAGYILKTNSSSGIIDSIKAVHKGNIVFDRDIAEYIAGAMDKNKKFSRPDFDITDKEYEIMELISHGFSNREIADKLFIGEGTVRNYISVILDKINLRDRTQLAIYFIRNIEE